VATIVVALALVTMSGCGSGDSPRPSTTARHRSSAVAHCAGTQCTVRVICKGRRSVRLGAAPVRIRTWKSAFRTSIIVDFAGSREDVVIRC
jgi:hypothetical protein